MAPDPDVRVEEDSHFRTSQATKSLVGPMMSPRIFPVWRRAPSQLRGVGAGVGGRISAMGLPKRVTRKGRPVLRTRSKVAKQVALNFEIAIESIGVSIPWSITMVQEISAPQEQVVHQRNGDADNGFTRDDPGGHRNHVAVGMRVTAP